MERHYSICLGTDWRSALVKRYELVRRHQEADTIIARLTQAVPLTTTLRVEMQFVIAALSTMNVGQDRMLCLASSNATCTVR